MQEEGAQGCTGLGFGSSASLYIRWVGVAANMYAYVCICMHMYVCMHMHTRRGEPCAQLRERRHRRLLLRGELLGALLLRAW